jgi:hypothetical protein
MWVSTTSGFHQCVGWRAQELAAPAFGGDGIEAGVHDDGAAVAADGEHIEIEWIGCRVIVRDDVVLELHAPVEDAVAQCENLVCNRHPAFSRCFLSQVNRLPGWLAISTVCRLLEEEKRDGEHP